MLVRVRSKILVSIFLVAVNSCGIIEWSGNYVDPISENYTKNKALTFDQALEAKRQWDISRTKINEVAIRLPAPCSSFGFIGIITPFTPPIPFFWPRSFSCNYFEVMAEPNLKIELKHKDKIYQPTSYDKNKKLYIFPLKAKNIDSGTIIIEKDGKKIEVPFEYKYLKFWY